MFITGNEDHTPSFFDVYPNPSSGDFQVTFKSFDEETLLELKDMNSNTIHSQFIHSEQQNITINEPAGVYLIVVTSKGKTQTHKIVKT